MKALKPLLALGALLMLFGCNEQAQSTTDNQPAAPVTLDATQIAPDTFANPLMRNGADPWLHYYDGNYYLTTTTWTSQLVMRKSPTLAGLADAPAHYIWSGDDPSRCCNFWAFEFHPLQRPEGLRWYVIVTAGIKENFGGQRNVILESAGTDPMGPYMYKGTPMPDHWNIDGSYFEHGNDLYFIWSEWHGDDQVNLISKMTNPWTLEGSRNVITKPEYDWEISGLRVNEGPEIITHNNKTFLVHSASFCNTEDYKLAVVELTGQDPLQPESWHKYPEPFFSKGNGVYGPGHHGFFTSPDGTEDWLVYHGNSSPSDGCSGTRAARAQPFTWTADGLPNFGEPDADKKQIPVPSGEQGPLKAMVQGVKVKIRHSDSQQCLSRDASGNSVLTACTNADNWVVDPANDGFYRLANAKDGTFVTEQQCAKAGTDVTSSDWVSSNCQRFSLDPARDGLFRITNTHSLNVLQACNSNEVAAAPNAFASCANWNFEPVSTLAMVNANSGRVVSVASCETSGTAKAEDNVEQYEYTASACQQWQATPTDQGYMTLASVANPQVCLAVNGVSDGKVDIADNLVVAPCNEPDSQWRVEYLPNGAQRLVSRAYGLAMKVENESIKNGDNLIQEVWKDTIYQHFYLREIPAK